MSKTVNLAGQEVPVTGADDSAVDAALASSQFQAWKSAFERDSAGKVTVKSIEIQSVDMFGPRVGFLKFKADAVLAESGKFVPGIVFARGGAVAVLVIVEADGEEPRALLTVQPRVAVGSPGLREIPAGMLDGSGNFQGVAAKELQEETGIVIQNSDLVDISAPIATALSTQGIYPSPGACDEFIRYYSFVKKVTKEELAAMLSKVYGDHSEGEHIRLEAVPLKDLPYATADSKTLTAIALYEAARRKDKLQGPAVFV